MPKIKTPKRNIRHAPAAPTSRSKALEKFQEDLKAEKLESEAISSKIDEHLSRGQRKRTARRERVQSKLNFAADLLQAKQQSLEIQPVATSAFNNISSLSDSLTLSLESTNKDESHADRARKKVTHKAKLDMLKSESQQLNQVLSHPKFQADPTNTILQHLSNTIAAASKKR
eukprot:c6351_g1_i1.p1 GENE.c6351_g1_i1~~c6351_g1_i1.p1  ORF type:complete len:184 (-),score=31.76 c6351_g1_i1:63-578(-)